MQKQPLKWVLDIQHMCILASSIFNEGPNSVPEKLKKQELQCQVAGRLLRISEVTVLEFGTNDDKLHNSEYQLKK
jgi:hypothetical protein